MKTGGDEINLNWLWRRLEGGGRVDGWSLASDGQFDCMVRASDGASWRRHRGLGIWAAVPARPAAAPQPSARAPGRRTAKAKPALTVG